MPRAFRLVTCLAALCAPIVGCASDVRVSYDRAEDFSRYRTWAWLPPSWPVPAPSRRVEPELDRIVRSHLESELEGRGFRRAESEESPDFYVSYHLALRSQLVYRNETPAMESLSTHHGGQGVVSGYEISRTEKREVQYEVGVLGVDVADGEGRQLVWRGLVERRVRDRYADGVAQAVAEILEHFPPEVSPR